MKRRVLASLIAAGCLAGVGTSRAAVLDVSVTEDVVQAPPGSIVEVSATLTNSTAEVVFINGITSGLSADLAQADVFAPFESFKPESLGPGESWEGPVLRLTISPSAPASVQVCDLALTGGAHRYDNQAIGLTYFSVDDSPIVTAVETDGAADLRIRTSPNPFRGDQSIRFATRSAGRFEVAVFDVSGRRVALLHSGDLEPGPHQFSWDGRSDSGAPQASGVYFVRVVGDNKVLKTKVLKVQ